MDRELLESGIPEDGSAEAQYERNRPKSKTLIQTLLKSGRRDEEKGPGPSSLHAEAASRSPAVQRPKSSRESQGPAGRETKKAARARRDEKGIGIKEKHQEST